MRRLAGLALVLVTACTCNAPVSRSPQGEQGGGKGQTRGTLTIRLPLEPTGLTRLHDRFAEGTMVRITVGPIYETLTQLAEK